MKKFPLVNIIIITTDQFAFVSECIKSVQSANYKNIHIYLVDNNSDKHKYYKFYYAHKHLKKITFLRLKRRTGFGGSCNFALKKIKKGYIVFLNDDTIVSKSWLNPIISYMERNLEVGACQPKIKNMRKKSYLEYAGGAGGFMDVYGYPFCRGRIFFTMEEDRGQYDDTVDVVWTSGNCMITKIDVIKKVGLFDDIYLIYQDEADLCWRMHFAGYKLIYLPKSVVYHYGSGTMGGPSPKKTFLHHRNGLILLLKHYTNLELARYLPSRILLDNVAFWYYLLARRSLGYALAVPRAYIDIFYLIPELYKRRRYAAFKKKKDNLYRFPIYKKSIVVEYFINKRNKFSQLKQYDFIN